MNPQPSVPKPEEADVRIQPTSFPWRSIQRASVSRYGMVRVMDPEGRLAWQFYLYGHRYAAPALGVDGTVYISGKWTNFYALRADAPLAGAGWPKFRRDAQNTGRARH